MKIWVIIYYHKYGTDAWPMVRSSRPTETGVKRSLRREGTWTEEDDMRDDSWIEILGPWDMKGKRIR